MYLIGKTLPASLFQASSQLWEPQEAPAHPLDLAAG